MGGVPIGGRREMDWVMRAERGSMRAALLISALFACLGY